MAVISCLDYLTVSLIAPSLQCCTGSVCLCLQPCIHYVELYSKLDHCAFNYKGINYTERLAL